MGIALWQWRRLISLSLIGLVSGVSLSLGSFPSLAQEPTPNILFILTDDLDTAAIDYMPKVKSLLIDRGVSFSNYFANIPLCCPSRTTILRGQYAHNTGIYTNKYPQGSFIALYQQGLEKSTIATWLQQAGYLTAFVGKYLNNYPRTAGKDYVPPGWDEWYSPINDSGYVGYNYTLNENGRLVHYGRREEDYNTDVYTSKAREFINRAAQNNQSFFAHVSYFAPHQPAIGAPRHRSLFNEAIAPRSLAFNEADVQDKPEYIRNLPRLDRTAQQEIDLLYQKRLRSLQAVDEGVADLIATLQANAQLENTYIIFSSDNGFHLGQHRLPPGKETAYEEDIHLPLYIRGPGIAEGKVIDRLVGNVDLAPTFADLAGVKIPKFVDGRSLEELLHFPLPTPFWRRTFLLQHIRDLSEVIVPSYLGLRTKNCSYVKYDNGERELYNLAQDPEQLNNLAQVVTPKLIKQYDRRLAQLKKCQGDRCREIELQPLPNCDRP